VHYLAFDCHYNVKAWMMGNVFEELGLLLEHQLKAEKWKILLPDDYCSAHKNVPHHGENNEVVFPLSELCSSPSWEPNSFMEPKGSLLFERAHHFTYPELDQSSPHLPNQFL
jgi:hypothetical protein